VQKPLAVVVVGGMMLAPILILVILPVLILMFSRRRRVPAQPAPAGERVPRAKAGPHGLAAQVCNISKGVGGVL
jgi:cobalt-zinc-cadmium resistance protein CzcA